MRNTSATAIAIHITDHQGAVTTIEGKIGKTLMEVATAKNINGIAADCGGLMSCATCHVFVQEPFHHNLARQTLKSWPCWLLRLCRASPIAA